MDGEQAPTIIDLKLSFLRSQILALSSPLPLPPNYTPQNDDDALRQKSIDEALYKLNTLLREHSKLVYSSQAARHVAEQIDRLYWAAGERDETGRTAEESAEVLERGVDLTAERNISKLPDEWEDEEEEDDERIAEYSESVGVLKDLDARRTEVRERIARYRALKEMLAPFENAKENIQPNLITRDGEMERELERMRMLVARVAGRIEALPERTADRDEEEMDVDVPDEERKVNELFGLT